MLHIEELRTAKVRVSLRFSRPDRFGINANLNPGFTGVLWIKYQLSMDVFEVASDVRDHHVPCAELRGSMSRLEKPLSHASPLTEFKSSRGPWKSYQNERVEGSAHSR